MFLRIAAILALVAILAAGAWYFFRDTAQKRLVRLQRAVDMLRESGSARDRDVAERLVNRILTISPGSGYALLSRALVNERKGTPEGFETALATYDELLAKGGRRGSSAALRKALLLRRLGRAREADRLCLTVMDSYPLAATFLMAETALWELDTRRALILYRRVFENFAESGEERAQALEGMADSYVRAIDASSTRSLPDNLDPDTRR